MSFFPSLSWFSFDWSPSKSFPPSHHLSPLVRSIESHWLSLTIVTVNNAFSNTHTHLNKKNCYDLIGKVTGFYWFLLIITNNFQYFSIIITSFHYFLVLFLLFGVGRWLKSIVTVNNYQQFSIGK